MLRPPTIVTWLSAVSDLLCMRRLTREKSVTTQRPRAERDAAGLNGRISMFG
jgi:hypothetical protein